MGLLIEGTWHDQWYDTASTGGRFVRTEAQFRNWITPDGSPGPSGEGDFRAEPGRYHLYVSLACPWAHRTLIYRELKGLTDVIGVSVVHPLMLDQGWTFDDDFPGATSDKLYGLEKLYQIYLKAKPDYTGRVTVPVLWDRERETIVSNESSEIIRMLDNGFADAGATPGTFRPDDLFDAIDDINERVYHRVNNGVYKAGFATTQDAYEEAVQALFAELDRLETILDTQRYIAGDRITEADWRLFTTLVRFDPVYVQHFKCNIRRIVDYPNLGNYLRELYQVPGIAETVNLDHIRNHYFRSHPGINPHGIIPAGPALNYNAPHDRDRLSAAT